MIFSRITSLGNGLILLSTILVVCAGAIGAAHYVIRENVASIEELEQDVQLAQGQVDRMEELKRTVRDIAPQRQRLDRTFVGTESIILFLDVLESHVLRTGATLEEDLRVQEATMELSPELETAAVAVDLTAFGPYANLVDLLTLIETMPYTLRIERMTLAETGTIARWRLDLRLVVAQDVDAFAEQSENTS